jgi:hypothetical protein
VLAALRFGATVLPIPLRAISASFAPLDVHEYVFGCESGRTRLAFEWVRSAAAPIRSAVSHFWSSSSRSAAFRSRSRANRCILSAPPFANFRAILRWRNTACLVLRGLCGVAAEPPAPIALSSTLKAAARSSFWSFVLWVRIVGRKGGGVESWAEIWYNIGQ